MGQFEAFIGVNFWTALFVFLNTLAIFFVGRKFLFQPIMKIIQQRQKEIDDMYTDADTAKQSAQDLQAQYHQKLSEATATGERLVKEAVARGQRREEEIIRQANAEAAAICDKAQEEIAREKKKAINDAKDEISNMAMAIAGKVVGRQLEAQDQSALVDSFIEQLGDSL